MHVLRQMLQTQSLLHISVHNVDIAVAIDGHEQVATTIVIDQRSRGLLVDVKTIAHRGLVVVIALVHLATACGASGIGDGADVTAFLAHTTGA